MAQQKNTRLEKHQLDAIADMVDRGLADNESEAHRMLLNAGKEEFGYKNGQTVTTDTALNRLTQKFGYVFALIGIVWLATTITYPVSLRMPAIAALSSSVSCFAMHKALDAREPAVTNKLRALVGGESA